MTSKITKTQAGFWAACFALLLAVRLCHVKVLWVDEAYGMAAARRILEGTALYRGLWFDKPPLYAWIYLPCWGVEGLPLRLIGAMFALLCCWLAARTATAMFDRREGYAAAALMAFYLCFDHPSAVISLAPDQLLIPFGLGMAWAAAAGQPMLAGAVAAAGLLANAKALLFLPLLILWRPRETARIAGGYLPAAAAVWIAAAGWWEPVWQWGSLYSRESLFGNPWKEGLSRTLNWAGFHAALVILAVCGLVKEQRHRRLLLLWLGMAAIMVLAGFRFFPRYYFLLLPACVVAAARGASVPRRLWTTWLVAAALAVPAVRFGWRHIGTLRREPAALRDLALSEDARDAAKRLALLALPNETLFVWGYRPELNVLARLPGTTRFLDSQPLTGVIADRHLSGTRVSAPELAARSRVELTRARPSFIADGLGPLNPALAITKYADLRAWLSDYEPVAQTRTVLIYRLRGPLAGGQRK
ncbi:MAG: hypothetical protein HY821_25090 [Acidobacteria bacterium]|nr:hypothetical protein [Acidobacteriota bacterium]